MSAWHGELGSKPYRFRFGAFERLVLRALVAILQNQAKGNRFPPSGYPELITELQHAEQDTLNTRL